MTKQQEQKQKQTYNHRKHQKEQKNDNTKHNQQTLSSLEFNYKNGDQFYFYRFYDDMPSYIKQVDSLNDDEGFPFIECIRVDANKPHTMFQSQNSEDPALYNRIMYNESKNDYTTFLKQKSPESSMARNGISRKQLDDLILWSSYYPDQPKFVFFDWDETLSCLSGILYHRNQFIFKGTKYNFKDDDILCYLLGGKNRLTRVSSVFKTLHNNNTEIYILSNNNTLVKHEEFFLRMLNLLSPKFKKKHLLPSRNTNQNKKEAFTKYFFKSHKESDIWRNRNLSWF